MDNDFKISNNMLIDLAMKLNILEAALQNLKNFTDIETIQDSHSPCEVWQEISVFTAIELTQTFQLPSEIFLETLEFLQQSNDSSYSTTFTVTARPRHLYFSL